MLWLVIILITSLIILLKLYLDSIYTYFSKRGVDTPPCHYFFGNIFEQIIFRKALGEILRENYNYFSGYNYFGFYNFTNKAVVVRNPDVIQDIMVKDFNHFGDNSITVREDADPIMAKNPFILNGSQWKSARADVAPNFSKSKTKKIAPILVGNSQKIISYINRTGKELNAKELAYRITAENVATCALGLNAGCFDSDDAKFLTITKEIFTPTFYSSLQALATFVFPQLSNKLKVRYFSKESAEYLTSIVKETLKYREEHNEVRHDFLDAMKEKSTNEKEFNVEDIVAHAGGLLLDGVETSSIALCHLLYEIAADKDIQQKLREEILNVIGRHGDKITSEAVDDMPYLDCVFKESLRLHSTLLFMSKQVTEDYTLGPMREDNTGPKLDLYVGDIVLIPTYAIHLDEKYFPNPLDFIPERFNSDNVDSIRKFTYLPFGEGPRKCLGMTFGILQLKVAVIIIIRNFMMTVNKRTQKSVEPDPIFVFNMPKGGYWIDFGKLD